MLNQILTVRSASRSKNRYVHFLLFYLFTLLPLHQVFDEIGSVAWEHVDHRDLNHRVAAGLQTHGGTGYIDQHLTCEGGVPAPDL